MSDFLKAVDGLPLLAKVILCIPVLEIFYGICRVVNGAVKNDVVWIVLAVLTIIPGAFFMWILAFVGVVWKGPAFLLGDPYFGKKKVKSRGLQILQAAGFFT